MNKLAPFLSVWSLCCMEGYAYGCPIYYLKFYYFHFVLWMNRATLILSSLILLIDLVYCWTFLLIYFSSHIVLFSSDFSLDLLKYSIFVENLAMFMNFSANCGEYLRDILNSTWKLFISVLLRSVSGNQPCSSVWEMCLCFLCFLNV